MLPAQDGTRHKPSPWDTLPSRTLLSMCGAFFCPLRRQCWCHDVVFCVRVDAGYPRGFGDPSRRPLVDPQHVTAERRFPPPWTVEEYRDISYIVRDANNFAVAYVYFEIEPGRAAAKLMTKDEARKIAAGIAKLPELLMRK